MSSRSTTRVAALALAACLAGGCGSEGPADKAGKVTAPASLRIAAQKGNYYAELFADAVRTESKGRLRIEFLPGRFDPNNLPADQDVRIARAVRDGRYDLAAVPARSWDLLGVRSLEPLEAPLLIDDQPTFEAVLADPVTKRLLGGLDAHGVVGLGLVMGQLTHPLGYEAPLVRPPDFRGKRIGAPSSRINDAVISALGALPQHPSFKERPGLVDRHRLDGDEMPFYAPEHAWITANVALSAETLTIVANKKAYGRLSDSQRRILSAAAAGAERKSLDYWQKNTERFNARHYCAAGHVALASPADLAALRRALQPVYGQLESDPQVAATIAAIDRIAGATKPDPAPRFPVSCTRPPSTAPAGSLRDPSFLDGTYRWRITRAGALKRHGDPNDPVIGTIAEVTLSGGWFRNFDGDTGTVEVVGNRITFVGGHERDTFTFRRTGDGTLFMEPVLPMDIGARVVFSSAPWKRVGPPIRKIP
jgi:TRAP-type C4-dicarboxylate transport system substrate-binding protein